MDVGIAVKLHGRTHGRGGGGGGGGVDGFKQPPLKVRSPPPLSLINFIIFCSLNQSALNYTTYFLLYTAPMDTKQQ